MFNAKINMFSYIIHYTKSGNKSQDLLVCFIFSQDKTRLFRNPFSERHILFINSYSHGFIAIVFKSNNGGHTFTPITQRGDFMLFSVCTTLKSSLLSTVTLSLFSFVQTI